MVTLTRNISDFGPHRILCLPLSAHCIQRELRHDVDDRASEYSVQCSSKVQALLLYISVRWVLNLSISWRHMAFQWIQPGFNKMVTDSLLRYLRKDFHRDQAPDLNPCDHFMLGRFKDRIFKKISIHFRKWKSPPNPRLKPLLQKLWV
jgi:hypothetical protein